MTRVKRGNVARKRRQKVLRMVEGYRGSALFRAAKQRNMKALRYSYHDRNMRKQMFRTLWIARINAAVRPCGTSYSRFVYRLQKSKICLNRKILSQLAVRDENGFQQLVKRGE